MTLDQLEPLLKAISAQGFSLPQARLLLLLKSGRLSMTEIAKKMGYSTAASTGSVDKSERDGLVIRAHSTDDRRAIHVALTEAGRTKLKGLEVSIKSVN